MYDCNQAATSDEISPKEKKLTKFVADDCFYKKIILQYTDGRFLTGYIIDVFVPNIPFIRFFQFSDNSTDKGTKIYIEDLKIIVFDQNIKETALNENSKVSQNTATTENKVEVEFKDGEILTGTLLDCRPNSFGFILSIHQNATPMRVFVASSAIKKIRHIKNLLAEQRNYRN